MALGFHDVSLFCALLITSSQNHNHSWDDRSQRVATMIRTTGTLGQRAQNAAREAARVLLCMDASMYACIAWKPFVRPREAQAGGERGKDGRMFVVFVCFCTASPGRRMHAGLCVCECVASYLLGACVV
jgi:hypothetical protein